MSISLKPLQCLLIGLTLATGCHAQTPSDGEKLSPELTRRVQVLLRSKAGVPATYRIEVGGRTPSTTPGYDEIAVRFVTDGQAGKTMTFLLSKDGKTLAQFNKFDISQDPRTLVDGKGRPARGGPEDAPVLVVGFDDLECPYCARMNEALFPALVNRYKDQVRFVYRDFPLSPEQHPWATHAAINVDCMAAQSEAGYWNLVDYIHAHADEITGSERTMAQIVAHSSSMLDTLTREEGQRQKVDAARLDACIAKQDNTAIRASIALGQSLGVDSIPILFINGEMYKGAPSIENVYRMIDDALIAAGQTPPPPQAPSAARPGN
ncbi:MAG: DsbA family protein [Acidobacteriaceae bacterium]|nr:DsbA family protein [Acidobacteriaceae bacterium]